MRKAGLQSLRGNQARTRPVLVRLLGDGRQTTSAYAQRYIGRASATASPEELRAILDLRQQRRTEAAERKHRRDTRSDTGRSTSGDCSEPGGDARTGRSARGSANAVTSGGTGSTSRDDLSNYDRSDLTKNDPFSRC